MSKRFTSPDGGPSQRQRRAGEVIRHALAEILQRDEVGPATLPDRPVTVTEVKASPDLRQATVFVTVLGRDDLTEDVAILNAAAPVMRQALGRKITMKFTPALHFKADGSFAEAAKIAALLKESDSDG